VWDLLERKVRLKDRPRGQEYKQELCEMNRLLDEIVVKGTDRERLTLELYDEIRYEPGKGQGIGRFRRLSLEEFQQFRSKFESMPNKELAEETCSKREKKNERIRGIERLPTLRYLHPLPLSRRPGQSTGTDAPGPHASADRLGQRYG
jgi:hypothetical protein